MCCAITSMVKKKKKRKLFLSSGSVKVDISWANQTLTPDYQVPPQNQGSVDNPVKQRFSKSDPLARLTRVWVCPHWKSIPTPSCYVDLPTLSGVGRRALTSFCKRGNKYLAGGCMASKQQAWERKAGLLVPSTKPCPGKEWAASAVVAAPSR